MKTLLSILFFLLLIYIAICGLMYAFQERLLFFPEKLGKNHDFRATYYTPFEEVFIPVKDGIALNALHFKTANPRGVVLFLHGNAGSLNSWGAGADLYLDKGYDVCYLDYRGYGKSQGEIISEKQLIADAQAAYDFLKEQYEESQIIISGTSIGTGMATQISAMNQPKYLILTSPYRGLQELIREKYPFIPPFLIKYKLQSHTYLEKINCPIFIFHGKEDQLIPCSHGESLAEIDDKIDLYLVEGYGHNDLLNSQTFIAEMNRILN
ncbi:MAG: alpha/beta fold hydrolase [Bacteroidota bacterium]